MPLQGTFDVLRFADVLHLLSANRLTGRLHLRSRTLGANMYMEDGQLVGADLGEHSPNSATDLQSRLEEICFELLDAERGSFEFTRDTAGMTPPTVSLDVDAVLDEARRQLDEWREIQAVVPSVDLHPHVVDSLPTDQVTFTRDRWRLITAIDGRRSIRAIARSVGLTDYETCRMVKELMDDGIVELMGGPLSAAGLSRETFVFVDDDVAEFEEERRAEGAVSNGPPAREEQPTTRRPGAGPGEAPGAGPGAGAGPAAGAEPDGSPASAGPLLPAMPAVPPPKPQEPRKKGRSGIVRIGKRPRPTPPS